MKKPSKKTYYSSSFSSSTITEIPVKSSPDHPPPIPITVHFHDDHHSPSSSSSSAAAKIQAAYRSYVVRRLVKKITAVEAEIDRLQKLIQRQETVDAVRSNEKEKLRINEALMVQLLKLDSVPGFDHGVRMLRKNLSRRIVGLQEVMDGICCDQKIMDGWDVWREWEEGFSGIEERVCRERGGEELERFCALNLGFRCLERFLRES